MQITSGQVIVPGNVGIGTTAPITKLQITAANASSPTANIFLDIDGSTQPGMGGQIVFGSSTSSSLTQYIATIQGVRSSLDDGSSNIYFQTTHVATAITPSTKMTILSDGNVGIGTTSPTSNLQVQGSTIGYTGNTAEDLFRLSRAGTGQVKDSIVEFSLNRQDHNDNHPTTQLDILLSGGGVDSSTASQNVMTLLLSLIHISEPTRPY